MLTGLLAVRNFVHGEHHDLWNVNADQDYHEEMVADAGTRPDGAVFWKLDRTAFGLSIGAAAGILLWLATLIGLLRGDAHGSWPLELLAQYFPGYRLSLAGSLVGLVYGFTGGFVAGWVTAALRNAALLLYVGGLGRWLEGRRLRRFLDYM